MDNLPLIEELSTKEMEKKLKDEFQKIAKDKVKEIGSFIFSEEAISRLQKLDSNLSNKNYVLLEGPAGSSKTKTVQIYCKIKGLELVQFNMSGETSEEDLKGRILSDETSFSGFKYIKGHFSDAFINGKILLLDEINLASQSVLNFIANILDSQILIIEQDENTNGRHIFKMHKNFRLIATQNPNDSSFICKRRELPEKLLQQFNVIYFPSMEKEELKYIAKEMAKQNGYEDENIIEGIIELHDDWTKSENAKDSPQCFTIRDINNIIKSISKKDNPDFPFDSLMCFYGMRYQPEKRQIFQNLIIEKGIPKQENNYIFPEKEYKNCYPFLSFQKVAKYAEIAISNKRHILFTGKEGVGITSIAKWIARNHSKDPEKDFTFVFTEETTLGDLIGRFIPTTNKSEKNLIEWKNGPLTNAVKYGYSGVFLNVDSIDSKILERLNFLLDQKENGDIDNVFKIPENPNLKDIDIHPNFCFYCTCKIEKLNSLSDAFLNRLTVIVIDDQLSEIKNNEESYKKLIRILMEQENLNLNFELKKDLIETLAEKLKDSELSMSELGRLTKCCFYLSKEFPELEPNVNINYIKALLSNEKNIDVPAPIIKKANDKINEFNGKKLMKEENFYFDSSKLKDLIYYMYTCMICKINTCLIGKTGIGKTNFAETFSQIFLKENENDSNHILFSFNSESTIENLYGTFAFEAGKSIIVEGPLYKSIKEGLTFIADEFNLAEESIIQSFLNILEVTTQSSNILIPGLNQIISFNKDFFLIICQNDSNTKGRRDLPISIKKKIRIFEYPEPTFQDINDFCQSIIKHELNYNQNEFIEDYYNLSKILSKFMESLNKKEIIDVGRWSMRDIRKILRRINNQRISSPYVYRNIKDIHQVLIYIFCGVPKNNIDMVFNELLPLIKDSFSLEDKEEVEKLRLMITSKPKIENYNGKIYLTKAECGKEFIGDLFYIIASL